MSWLLIPLMAVINRLSGMDKMIAMRQIYWTAPLAGLVGLIFVDWKFGLLVFLSMAIYRVPGWFCRMDASDFGEFIAFAGRSTWFAIPFVITERTDLSILEALAAGLLISCAYALTWRTAINKLKDPGIVSEGVSGLIIGGYYFAQIS